MMQCKLKKSCPDQGQELLNCWRDDCQGMIHLKCCNLLLDRYEVPTEERPVVDGEAVKDSDGFPLVFCTVTCYRKWSAHQKKLVKAAQKGTEVVKKKRVAWEEDGSLDVLMEWITTESNYASYCGANANKSGKSKSQYHKEIAILIKNKKPESDRDAKDVENKITSLERQFRLAMDWRNNTGQGVENPGEFNAATLKRCPLWEQLEPIMGDRPNAKPLATNESDDSESESSLNKTTSTAPTAVDQSTENPKTPAKTVVNEVPNDSGTKRLTASNSGSSAHAKKKGKADDVISSFFGGVESEHETTYHSLRVREVEAREKEASARMVEANANKEKVAVETRMLAIDEKVKLLTARKALLDSGAATEEDIDNYLPLP